MSKLITIAPSEPFLERVATEWLKQTDPVGKDKGGPGLLLVPSRRAGRALIEAFLRVLDGEAALLPRIVAINDIDEEAWGGGDADLPPSVEPQRRLATLSLLILQTPIVSQGLDRTKGIDRAWPLAKALADLMDEAERSGVDLSNSLPNAVDEQFSAHWQQTLQFLEIITEIWPQWLQEEGVSNPIARQVARFQEQARSWSHTPPETPVWAIGFADGSAAVSDVLKAVLNLPQGKILLPGVDLGLPDEVWENLPPAHPQAGLREILNALEAERSELVEWRSGRGDKREALFQKVMLPEQAIAVWGQDLRPHDITGLSVLPAEDQQQEAQAIALILRNTVSVPGKTCALVTPDRALARRVGVELLRFGIHVDDSAGEALAQTPVAIFLRLIAMAAEAKLSPVALLAVLKHPLASLGRTPGDCHASARQLERLLLRGPAPAPGIAGLRARLEELHERHRTRQEVYNDESSSADLPDVPEGPEEFIDRIEKAFEPLLTLSEAVPLPDLLEALVKTAEMLAAREDELTASVEEERHPGERLWAGEDGELLSRHLAALIQHTALLPSQKLGHLDSFLNTSMSGQTLTGFRSHRGGVELAHPRVSILGVLESRLLTFDVVVLGGLNETIWPPATDPGPWLSRPMRTKVGLPSPERQTGISAHDFLSKVLSAKEVVFSNAARRDGSPGVPARWMVRLNAFLGGRGQKLPIHPALSWQRKMDQPLDGAETISPPEPRPPVALRPRRLSITEIERWMQDPYEIYAKHILKLRALDPLEEGAEHVDFGIIVHAGMERIFKRYPHTWPENIDQKLKEIFFEELKKLNLHPARLNWWRPRLDRIADWVVQQEQAHREERKIVQRYIEASASYILQADYAPFKLTGRADRIDVADDGLATILDYKTGQPPTGAKVEGGWSVQLVLEGALLAQGGFKDIPSLSTTRLLYWHLTGNNKSGEEKEVPGSRAKRSAEDLIKDALENLRSLVNAYDDLNQAYRSQPWAHYIPRYTDYAQLARVYEWRAAYAEGNEG
ncbi:double-strand break repair protein AddB [Swingsia samuiensis]|uniref:Double-strand break repair protein AddB n=1 Tax=Swingsia samuiensis TaxID=1293412 RepID=A0A4Y6UGI7_9PROT|nr:double-strand break repair protein AddB [Swingsia samuiensis]QDH16663.1 double-strand break repair protein AddB [Swingsia samuiensis]